jgi:hypothetical protein
MINNGAYPSGENSNSPGLTKKIDQTEKAWQGKTL